MNGVLAYVSMYANYLSDGLCQYDFCPCHKIGSNAFQCWCFHMYGFQYGKINVQTKSACRSDFPYFPHVNYVKVTTSWPRFYSWYNHKEDEGQD